MDGIYLYSINENQVTMFPWARNSMPCFSARSVTSMPWLSTQGNMRSGKRQGASGHVQCSQWAQASVDSVSVCAACSLTIESVDKEFYIAMAKKRINDFLGIKPEKKAGFQGRQTRNFCRNIRY